MNKSRGQGLSFSLDKKKEKELTPGGRSSQMGMNAGQTMGKQPGGEESAVRRPGGRRGKYIVEVVRGSYDLIWQGHKVSAIEGERAR